MSAMSAVMTAELMPVSGRDQPREIPDPAFRHAMVLHGLPNGEIRVICTCVENGRQWARTFEPGHTPNDFVRLQMQHITGRSA